MKVIFPHGFEDTMMRVVVIEDAQAKLRRQEARRCLDHLLVAAHAGVMVRRLLTQALNDEPGFDDILKAAGIWPEPDEDGFVIANRHTALDLCYSGTAWANGEWQYVLRRLPGARPVQPRRFERSRVTRGIFMPAVLIDLIEP